MLATACLLSTAWLTGWPRLQETRTQCRGEDGAGISLTSEACWAACRRSLQHTRRASSSLQEPFLCWPLGRQHQQHQRQQQWQLGLGWRASRVRWGHCRWIQAGWTWRQAASMREGRAQCQRPPTCTSSGPHPCSSQQQHSGQQQQEVRVMVHGVRQGGLAHQWAGTNTLLAASMQRAWRDTGTGRQGFCSHQAHQQWCQQLVQGHR